MRAPYRSTIRIDGSTIQVEFAPGPLDLPVTKLIAWISNAARAVTDYYGRFPIPEAQILIVPVKGRGGVLNGTSWGTHPAFTRIYVGQLTSDTDLKNDWVMTHETLRMRQALIVTPIASCIQRLMASFLSFYDAATSTGNSPLLGRFVSSAC